MSRDLFKNILNKKTKETEKEKIVTALDFKTLDLNKKNYVYAWAAYWKEYMKNSKGEL